MSSSVALADFAPAKVNLTLRVVGRRADGYHELESLVVFADFGDRLSFVPGGELALTVRGPSAAQAGDAFECRRRHDRIGRVNINRRAERLGGID